METFKRWLQVARAGARFVYFRGSLATAAWQDWRVQAFAEEIRKEGEAGMVHLVQRRKGPGVFEYIAVRSRVTRRRVEGTNGD